MLNFSFGSSTFRSNGPRFILAAYFQWCCGDRVSCLFLSQALFKFIGELTIVLQRKFTPTHWIIKSSPADGGNRCESHGVVSFPSRSPFWCKFSEMLEWFYHGGGDSRISPTDGTRPPVTCALQQPPSPPHWSLKVEISPSSISSRFMTCLAFPS